MGKSSVVLWINLLKEEIKRCLESVLAGGSDKLEGGEWEQSEEIGMHGPIEPLAPGATPAPIQS